MTGNATKEPPQYSGKAWLWPAGIALIVLLLFSAINFIPNLLSPPTTPTVNGVAELYTNLRADPSSIRGNWLRTFNPRVQDVQGDLVWSPRQQQGVMRFINLPAPPSGRFYQLWLYDARNTQTPVSGAIFRKGSGKSDWYKAIYPETQVASPYKFELKLESDNNKTPPQLMLMVQP